ncbi:uncharacterized protein LOC117647987 [Thrips palmi]|uniref:Uncharacterized protein LOC117647987 n=1 Tax=Thrips palmi TaxID=161013 RepID=A0A6P8ZC46_THRPL|nr:uncharacterized protein LOC117647987 [Thrips palmi]
MQNGYDQVKMICLQMRSTSSISSEDVHTQIKSFLINSSTLRTTKTNVVLAAVLWQVAGKTFGSGIGKLRQTSAKPKLEGAFRTKPLSQKSGSEAVEELAKLRGERRLLVNNNLPRTVLRFGRTNDNF